MDIIARIDPCVTGFLLKHHVTCTINLVRGQTQISQHGYKDALRMVLLVLIQYVGSISDVELTRVSGLTR